MSVPEKVENNYVNLIVEGKIFKVRKQKLADQSEYFRGLFYGGFAESKQNEIQLEIPLEPFEWLLRYLNLDPFLILEFPNDIDKTIEIYKLAHQLAIIDVLPKICDHLLRSYDDKNLFGLIPIIFYYQDLSVPFIQLAQQCYLTIDANAEEIVSNPEFTQLTVEIVQAIIGRNTFYLPELRIAMAANDWAKANPDFGIVPLRSQVHLKYIRKSNLMYVVKPMELLGPDYIDKVLEKADNSPPRVKVVLNKDLIENFFHIKNLTEQTYQVHVIDAPCAYMINYIGVRGICKFETLKFKTKLPTFKIETSLDGKTYDLVRDKENDDTYSFGTLFYERAVRYIRYSVFATQPLSIELKAMYWIGIPRTLYNFNNDFYLNSMTLDWSQSDTYEFNWSENL